MPLFSVIHCEEKGCKRRCGGQGDVLAGVAGLFSFWTAEKEEQ
jgi:NAD(P)H-hydrate repair Nnr-like enzyme with NAD(P)H-hydrate dehydratase domain